MVCYSCSFIEVDRHNKHKHKKLKHGSLWLPSFIIEMGTYQGCSQIKMSGILGFQGFSIVFRRIIIHFLAFITGKDSFQRGLNLETPPLNTPMEHIRIKAGNHLSCKEWLYG